MSDQDGNRGAAPLTDGGTARLLDDPPRCRRLLLSLGAVAVVVAITQPFSGIDVGGRASFVPAMLGLVYGLDLLSAVLLVREFRDSGERRALALSTAYVFSLAVLAGYGAAFPGVLGEVGPLGRGRRRRPGCGWSGTPGSPCCSRSRWPRGRPDGAPRCRWRPGGARPG